MARKIYEGTCPYCGNELTIDPVGETKTYKERPRYPKVGDIRHCPFCSWRYQVSDVRKNRLVLSEYINANRMRRKEKKEKRVNKSDGERYFAKQSIEEIGRFAGGTKDSTGLTKINLRR